ncbi:MAG: HIT domain-containing protein [Mycobacteriaceae bacterium]
MSSPDCLFCAIVAGDVPATVVRRGARTVAFRDINPQAPTHVLVVPTVHQPDAAAMAAADPGLLAEVFCDAVAVAEAENLVATGYRLLTNTGVDAGQTVFHLHVHVLGGEGLGGMTGGPLKVAG